DQSANFFAPWRMAKRRRWCNAILRSGSAGGLQKREISSRRRGPDPSNLKRIMSDRHTGHGDWASGQAGWHPSRILLLLIALPMMVFAAVARAGGCIELPYADVSSLQSLSFQDPKRALEVIRKTLASAQSSNPVDRRRAAALYAAQ